MDKEALTEYENRAALINGLARRLADLDITNDQQWVIQLVPTAAEIMRGGPNQGPAMVYNMFLTLGSLFASTMDDDEIMRMMMAFTAGHAAMISAMDARMASMQSGNNEVKDHEQEQGNSNSRTTH